MDPAHEEHTMPTDKHSKIEPSPQEDTRTYKKDNGEESSSPTSPPSTKPQSQSLPKDQDPFLVSPPDVVQDGDYVLLVFADQRHVFAHCKTGGKNAGGIVKLFRRDYSTRSLVGLPYGTLLEVERNCLKVLPHTEGFLPDVELPDEDEADENNDTATDDNKTDDNEDMEEGDNNCGEDTKPSASKLSTSLTQSRDNRHIYDTNQSQGLKQDTLLELKKTAHGKDIVQQLISNSTSFAHKTDFSKAKYIAKKQQKYQPRCRLTRCTGATVSQALFVRDPKKIGNLRSDTLAQMLSYANVTAGGRVLCWEDAFGLVTGSIVERLGGYGHVYSVYTGQQPCGVDALDKFNFNLAQQQCLQWVHAGDVLNWEQATKEDVEAQDRDAVQWPCPLRAHTRNYLHTELNTPQKQMAFLDKRSARFTRKLTRPSPLESVHALRSRPVNSLILCVRGYDLTATLSELLPFLAPSCPFVVVCEYLEPLVQVFDYLQEHQLAIYLRLCTSWTREYQVLPNRTHPNMNMTQSGGFLLTGTRLDPVHGQNELPPHELEAIRATLPTRRGRKRPPNDGCDTDKAKKNRNKLKTSQQGNKDNGGNQST